MKSNVASYADYKMRTIIKKMSMKYQYDSGHISKMAEEMLKHTDIVTCYNDLEQTLDYYYSVRALKG